MDSPVQSESIVYFVEDTLWTFGCLKFCHHYFSCKEYNIDTSMTNVAAFTHTLICYTDIAIIFVTLLILQSVGSHPLLDCRLKMTPKKAMGLDSYSWLHDIRAVYVKLYKYSTVTIISCKHINKYVHSRAHCHTLLRTTPRTRTAWIKVTHTTSSLHRTLCTAPSRTPQLSWTEMISFECGCIYMTLRIFMWINTNSYKSKQFDLNIHEFTWILKWLYFILYLI
jgi:hypothetical protein